MDERYASGLRRSRFIKMSAAEIEFVKSEIRAINADEQVFVFKDFYTTGYVDGIDTIFISSTVFPDVTSSHNRDRLSVRAVLAHEYYGHRAHRGTAVVPQSWNDEFRASYQAAVKAPNLSDGDRRDLMLDALERAREAGVEIRYNGVIRRFIYGYDD